MGSEVKWIKIVTDIFDDEKILLIESMPEGDSVVVIWFKLLCLAGKSNHGGVLVMSDRIHYNDAMLSSIFRRPLTIVRMALDTFEKFGMIEIINDAIAIPNWERHQNIEGMERAKELTKNRVQKFRENQKLVADCNALRNVTSNATKRSCNDDALISISNTNKDIEGCGGKKEKHKYGEFHNVLLTDDQRNQVTDDEVQNLSFYIESKGAVYKNHYATIKNWRRRNGTSEPKPMKSLNDQYSNSEGIYT